MSIHVEENGVRRCTSPDKTLNDLLKQRFEGDMLSVGIAEEAIESKSIRYEELVANEIPETPVATPIFKPETCIKESLNKLKSNP